MLKLLWLLHRCLIFLWTHVRKKPIFTNHDAKTAKALASQWCETSYHLCSWHLYQNAIKKPWIVLLNNFENSQKILAIAFMIMKKRKNLFKLGMRYSKNTIMQIMIGWSECSIQKKNVYLIYGREMFCVDMTTTQQCESMVVDIKRYKWISKQPKKLYHCRSQSKFRSMQQVYKPEHYSKYFKMSLARFMILAWKFVSRKEQLLGIIPIKSSFVLYYVLLLILSD